MNQAGFGSRPPRSRSLLASAIALALACAAFAPATQAATAATQIRINRDARIVDLGLAPATDVKNITIALQVVNAAAMKAQIAATVNPASPSYRHFLTPAQFAAQYGQSSATVAQVVAYLQSAGVTVTKVYPNNLLISAKASNAQLAALFGTPIHSYSRLGVNFQAPAGTAVIPAALAGVVQAVTGLSTKPMYVSHAKVAPMSGPGGAEAGVMPTVLPAPNAVATGVPGSYTTADLANQYNINPVYQAGVTGAGKTIGIITLAGYLQSDAYAYWSAIGQPVKPGRITDVLVDGGALPDDGPGSDGAGETTLDVEQSGGVAPGADMRVYIAPNAGNGFIDAFATALSENLVDTISVSWGAAEIYNDGPTLDAFNLVFAQAALQGIPVIAASGDAGAFDVNRNYVYPYCTTLLSVDHPAADPYVLAAGGTTLPGTIQHKHGPTTVPVERPWGWDYLQAYITQWYGQAFYAANYMTVGGGGGVSVDFSVPSYQVGLAGVKTSQRAQSLFCNSGFLGLGGNTYFDLVDMPAGFAGRNVPDVSLNADPYTGYLVYANGAFSSGSGGTSFVAPQLNGIFTLVASAVGGRLGLLQPQLYAMFQARGYGATSPFNAVTAGDNQFYAASAQFNPATGLGTLNVLKLARAFGAAF